MHKLWQKKFCQKKTTKSQLTSDMVPVATKFPLSLTAKAEYVKPKLENIRSESDIIGLTQGGESKSWLGEHAKLCTGT
jgi:hypothetical protein